jgi:hypothetical protein
MPNRAVISYAAFRRFHLRRRTITQPVVPKVTKALVFTMPGDQRRLYCGLCSIMNNPGRFGAPDHGQARRLKMVLSGQKHINNTSHGTAALCLSQSRIQTIRQTECTVRFENQQATQSDCRPPNRRVCLARSRLDGDRTRFLEILLKSGTEELNRGYL